MSKSNTFENEFLRLLCNNTNIGLVCDATGLHGSTTAGSLYLGLHTADPGPGVQLDAIAVLYRHKPMEVAVRHAAYNVDICGKDTPV